MQKPSYLTKRQAAVALGVHTTTVDRYRREGLLTEHRAPAKSRVALYLEAEVLGLLRPQPVSAAEVPGVVPAVAGGDDGSADYATPVVSVGADDEAPEGDKPEDHPTAHTPRDRSQPDWVTQRRDSLR